jgi:hypothetical protein
MSCSVISCHLMPSHAIPRHPTPCHVTHAIPTSCRARAAYSGVPGMAGGAGPRGGGARLADARRVGGGVVSATTSGVIINTIYLYVWTHTAKRTHRDSTPGPENEWLTSTFSLPCCAMDMFCRARPSNVRPAGRPLNAVTKTTAALLACAQPSPPPPSHHTHTHTRPPGHRCACVSAPAPVSTCHLAGRVDGRNCSGVSG